MGVKKYMEDKIKIATKRLDEKTEFIAVDFFRLLFAIGIVALHLAPMQDINETLNYFVVHVLTRLGVPFFFLQKKIQDVQKVKAYLARIFQLYVIYTVLYLPQIVYVDRKAGGFWGGICWTSCGISFWLGRTHSCGILLDSSSQHCCYIGSKPN